MEELLRPTTEVTISTAVGVFRSGHQIGEVGSDSPERSQTLAVSFADV